MDLEVARRPAGQHRVGRLGGADLGGHAEVVLCRHRRRHKAGVDDRHADAARREVEVKRLGQMRQRGLAGPIGQSLGQAAEAGHAGDQAQVAAPRRQQLRQQGLQQVQRADVVDVQVAARIGQVKGLGAHGTVVAGAVDAQVDGADGGRRLPERGQVQHIQRQCAAAGVGSRELVQQVGLPRRHDHARTGRMQGAGGRTANAAGCANQPDAASGPVLELGVERHQGFRKDKVTSPTPMPNLLMRARFNITWLSTRYIQSSNCTS
mmetsp:Transcript_22755/g.42024  ORF Transcript_22755/g.42024 Transcript_22755/m.42024 type:complete len:264 (+) Transcript_22755:996-1787(+)